MLGGVVTGRAGGVATNRPVAGARVEVFRVEPATAQRMGEALLVRETGADGAWGPVAVGNDRCLEFVLAAPGQPIAHTFRSPFPRSTGVLHLRPPTAAQPAKDHRSHTARWDTLREPHRSPHGPNTNPPCL